MSQGDEIEAGDPRRYGRPMGAYDDADDAIERPSVRKPGRSGAVTAVGIIGIILGSLGLVVGLCGVGLGAAMPAMRGFVKNQGGNDPNLAKAAQDLDRIPVWFIFAEAAVGLFRGIGLLVGSVLVLKRSNFGRFLTLAMAVFGILAGLADNGLGLAMGFMEPSGLIGAGFGILFGLAFAVFAFVVLLSPKNAAEFRPT